MGPVLATEGELRQTGTNTMLQQCVKANGAGAVASNDGKRWKYQNHVGSILHDLSM